MMRSIRDPRTITFSVWEFLSWHSRELDRIQLNGYEEHGDKLKTFCLAKAA